MQDVLLVAVRKCAVSRCSAHIEMNLVLRVCVGGGGRGCVRACVCRRTGSRVGVRVCMLSLGRVKLMVILHTPC